MYDDHIDLIGEKALVSFLLQTETVTLIFGLKHHHSLTYYSEYLSVWVVRVNVNMDVYTERFILNFSPFNDMRGIEMNSLLGRTQLL